MHAEPCQWRTYGKSSYTARIHGFELSIEPLMPQIDPKTFRFYIKSDKGHSPLLATGQSNSLEKVMTAAEKRAEEIHESEIQAVPTHRSQPGLK